MDTNVIEVRKVIPIIKYIAGASSWTQNITIDFIPDEVIVKSFAYRFDGTEVSINFLYSDLVNDIMSPILEGDS